MYYGNEHYYQGGYAPESDECPEHGRSMMFACGSKHAVDRKRRMRMVNDSESG